MLYCMMNFTAAEVSNADYLNFGITTQSISVYQVHIYSFSFYNKPIPSLMRGNFHVIKKFFPAHLPPVHFSHFFHTFQTETYEHIHLLASRLHLPLIKVLSNYNNVNGSLFHQRSNLVK